MLGPRVGIEVKDIMVFVETVKVASVLVLLMCGYLVSMLRGRINSQDLA